MISKDLQNSEVMEKYREANALGYLLSSSAFPFIHFPLLLTGLFQMAGNMKHHSLHILHFTS